MDHDQKAMLDRINALCKNTLMEHLGIRYTALREAYLEAEMEVGPQVHQPMGLLHGGATAALAESVGSAASLMLIDPSKEAVVGIELAANHVRSVREGVVRAQAKLLHGGRRTHLWEIRIVDEANRLISQCKLTNMVIEKKEKK